MDALTEFEIAILKRISEVNAGYRDQLLQLIRCGRVVTREWSGVGGFIAFEPNAVQFEPSNLELDAEAEIQVPKLRHGMGALLFVRGGKADFLELSTYGEEWWGDHTGFRIVPTPVTRADAT
ncbi:MAG: hypothetical protein ACREH8_11705 [Opitutaceae bacterium]